MDIRELNKISIKAYLANKGIHPVKDRGYYGMYHSPFREDKDASMKVDYNKNLWIDFGSNEGGTMIDLVMRINNCSFTQAINELKKYSLTSVNQHVNTTVRQQNSFSFHGINILNVGSLSNSALIDYLKERSINIDIAKQHCREIHYSANNKEYFAIGFENNSNGYELRNKYFKGCTSKDITIHRSEDKEACLVFEGFIDYLSFLTLKNIQTAKQNVIVLNSVGNLSKALKFTQSYPKIYIYLDNDEAGRKATDEIRAVCKFVQDQSASYAKYKDLNDYLVATKQVKQLPKSQLPRKPLRGFRM